MRKATPAAEAVRAQVAANPSMFMNLLTFIFQLVVFDDTQHQWTLSRAMLAVILAAEAVRPDVRFVHLPNCTHGTAGYLRFGPIERIFLFFMTSACARRIGAAARMEQRRRER